jgi:hypothetical protein
MILSSLGIIGSGKSGCGYADSDVCAFITAASITDITQKNAINQLVLDLKAANIWTKMKAIYPFVGGTASSHKFNLKDPRDLNDAHRLFFFGGGTHSINGYKLDGLTSYADTNLPDSFPLDDFHFSMYSRTNQASEFWDFGASIGTTATLVGAKVAYTEFWAFIQGTSQRANISNSNTQGYYIATRYLNGNNVALYKNNTQVFNASKPITGNTNLNYYIGALNSSGSVVGIGSNKELALISIGYGLNSTQATSLTNAVQNYQITLGRNIY